MIDARIRRWLSPPLDRVAQWLDRRWMTPNRLTAIGLAWGLASAVLAATQLWGWALACWLISRVFDGLDGALARHRHRHRHRHDSMGEDSELGGFLDIVADFVAYGATVVGVAIGTTAAFDAPWYPFLWVLFAYYINGTAFLAFSSIAERTGRQVNDGRSLSFIGRIAEGTETIIVHSLWLIFPAFAGQIALVWAVIVLISAAQRIFVSARRLR